MTFTASEITTTIANCERRAEFETLHHQVRGLINRGFLKSIPNQYGPRGVLYYADRDLYRARILVAALDCGVRADRLQTVNAFLEDGLDDLFTGLLTDEFYALEIARVRDLLTGESADSVVWIKQNADGTWNRGTVRADPLHSDTEIIGGRLEGVITVPVSALCRALALHMQEAA